MGTFSWHITEGFQHNLSRPQGSSGLFSVNTEDFDIAISDIPFLLFAGPDTPYERQTAQWQKDQFDADRNVGEQSLTGWWLRSQASFRGGSGVTYFEPLLGEGSESRFRDSRGVDVFSEAGEVTLLHETVEEVSATNPDISLANSSTRVLIRNGGSCIVWNGTTENAVTGTTTANGLAYTGGLFLVGDDTTIYSLAADSGTALASLWTGSTNPITPYWAKQRIFATSGRDIFELTLAGGVVPAPGAGLFQHPDPNWEWTSITETGGAVWAAGHSGTRSAIHTITIGDDGSTPALTGSRVGVQLPDGELVNAVYGYLDFLVVATSRGLRVAITDGDQAQLGPILFDEEVLSLTARGDFVWGGLASGLTRRIDLGTLVSGELGFAWANDLEASGVGEIRALAWLDDKLCLAESGTGLWAEQDTLVPSGTLTTGFIRYGTLEPKHIQNARVSATVTSGTLGVSVQYDENDPSSVDTLPRFSGSRDVALNISQTVERFSLIFQLNRDTVDTAAGPVFRSYQLRALPTPTKRQRLMQFPLMCFDKEKDRKGIPMGNTNFAWSRLNELERLEIKGTPVILQDFRNMESRVVVIDKVHFAGPDSPDRGESNFGGTIMLTVRTVD